MSAELRLEVQMNGAQADAEVPKNACKKKKHIVASGFKYFSRSQSLVKKESFYVCKTTNSDAKWLLFRLQQSLAHPPPPERSGELQWPSHKHLDTSSTVFFSEPFYSTKKQITIMVLQVDTFTDWQHIKLLAI